MPFPPVERVIYDKNPLEDVIGQLRFPPILKIETGVPDDFQERIRDRYPDYVANAVGVPAELRSILPAGLSGTNHEFQSRDKKWKVSLTKSFIALTSKEYIRWEDFKERFRPALEALGEIYKPTVYDRTVLR